MATITEVIARTAVECGMEFLSGFPKNMLNEKMRFPMVWLEPPTLVKKEGYDEGYTAYSVRAYVMDLDKNHPQMTKEELIAKLERSAIRLCYSLADDSEIISVEKLECTPLQTHLTNYGETALGVKFQASKIYCINNL